VLEILDSLRRIVSRWVETVTPIRASVSPGDTILTVDSSKRFRAGDEVQIEDPIESEPNLIIDEIIDFTHVRLATPVFNAWSTSQNILLRKLTNGLFIEGIYIGNPQVIQHYPAITINGTTESSEWLTLDSTKERFEVELSIFVQASNYEDGYRYLLKMVKLVKDGLKANIFPLVSNFDMTSVTANIAQGDEVIRVADTSVFNTPLTVTTGGYPRLSDARVIIEDRWKSEETRCQEILSPTEATVRPTACGDYATSNNPIVIVPKRFIYNSWPHQVDIGKTSKGSLLQAAVIRWFAEEEVPVDFKNNDPHLK
jgi:hypothetical protein